MTTFEELWGRGERGSGRKPPSFARRRGSGFGRSLIAGLGVVVVVLLALAIGSSQFLDYLWFQALGFESVFVATFAWRIGLFAFGLIVTFVLLAANLSLARRWAAPKVSDIPREELVASGSGVNWIVGLTAGFVGLIMALVVSSEWNVMVRALYAQPFGVADPIFGQDLGFYLFTLPAARLAQTLAVSLVVVTLVGVIAAYAILLASERQQARVTRPVIGHVSALAALALAIIAVGYWLDRFDLLYGTGRAVYGAGYTDVNARLPGLTVLAGIAAVGALVLIANVWSARLWPVIVVALAWLGASIVLTGLWPAFVQRFVVEPSELTNETPFLTHNIRFTRLAYGLDRIEERQLNPTDDLTIADVQRNAGTIDNIRLWDYRPLRDTLNQIQSIRLYYTFPDVDVDRYVINGQYRQVMLSARELPQDQLAARVAQNWVTRRLQFTHGYGVAMVAVNEVTSEGLPRFFVRDVPPVGDIRIDRPGIYFGERTDQYVIVGSTDPDLEFDFPRGDENVSTRYQGSKGVSLASPVNRLLAAYRFADPNIMISSYIGPETQLLFTRDVRDRARKIAPFLNFDADPYIVVHEGRLVWILDAYTSSDRFPYSDPFRRVVAGQTIALNYIRNSVKVTVDAYDGGVTFYVIDDADPILRAYRQAFPTLFRPVSEMPATLRAHLRYPEFLFSVQADRFALYHMTDPQVFFNREDQWAIPRDLYAPGQNALPMEPYYVIMKLPGETREEFALILPYTPSARDNMIAWLAARSDGDNYGRLMVARFPKDRLVFGPAQIGARINQDPTISAQISLWNQQGSRVIRGNLLVLPIERSILYIEPIFLQAERSQLPELKRVVLATANRVVMEPTLGEALARLLNQPLPPTGAPGQQPPAQLGQAPIPADTDVAALARSAQARFERAQQRLREGDFAGYGEEIRLLEAELRRLVEATTPR